MPSLGKVVLEVPPRGPRRPHIASFASMLPSADGSDESDRPDQQDQQDPRAGARPLANGPFESLWADPRARDSYQHVPALSRQISDSEPVYGVCRLVGWVRLGGCNTSIPWQLGQPL